MAYAELPLAQHAFDVLASLRCQATTAGVIAFLDAVRAGRRAAPQPVDPTRRAGPRAGWPTETGPGWPRGPAARPSTDLT